MSARYSLLFILGRGLRGRPRNAPPPRYGQNAETAKGASSPNSPSTTMT